MRRNLHSYGFRSLGGRSSTSTTFPAFSAASRPLTGRLASPLPIISSRHYAEAAAAASREGKLILTLSSPHETIFTKEPVEMVTVPATSGEMGIQAENLPLVAQLEPGTVIVSKQEDGTVRETEYFISGGFVTVFDDSTCNINVLEAVPLSTLDPERVKRGLEEFQKEMATASDPDAKAVAEIGVEVHQAMAYALKI